MFQQVIVKNGKIAFKTMGKAMAEFVKNGINPDFSSGGIEFKDWEKMVESGEFRRKLFMGIGSNGPVVKDPIVDPGLLTIGGQGSGKSTFLKGLCATLYASSGDVSFFLYQDYTNKGMGDYKMLYRETANSAKALFEIEKIIVAIDLAYDELEKRGQAFKDMDGANNLDQYNYYGEAKHKKYCELYEQIKDKKISNLSEDDKQFLSKIAKLNLLRLGKKANDAILSIVNSENLSQLSSETIEDAKPTEKFYGAANYFLIFEEFHKVPESDEVRFQDNKMTTGTVAYKMFQIARTGRSFGMCILAATQSAKVTEFPSDLKIGITNIYAHKTSDAYAGSSVDLDPSQIRTTGRSISKDGYVQFPRFTDETIEQIVEKYKVKKLNGFLFGAQVEEYHKALDGSGAEGMILSYDFRKIIDNYQIFSKSMEVIVRRMLNSFGYEMLPIEKGSVTDLKAMAVKDGVKYAVFYQDFKGGRRNWGEDLSDKKLETFRSDMEIFECDGGLISLAFGENSALQRFVKSNGGVYMDLEDLKNSASVVDNWENLEKSGNLNKKLEQCPLSDVARNKGSGGEKKSKSKKVDMGDMDIEFDDDADILARLSKA